MEGIKKKLNNLKLQLEDAQENETVLKKGKKELEDEVDEVNNNNNSGFTVVAMATYFSHY